MEMTTHVRACSNQLTDGEILDVVLAFLSLLSLSRSLSLVASLAD